MADQEPGWDLFRSFLAVLDAGSLSGAARVLGTAQPTVGRHIEALEQGIGRRPPIHALAERPASDRSRSRPCPSRPRHGGRGGQRGSRRLG